MTKSRKTPGFVWKFKRSTQPVNRDCGCVATDRDAQKTIAVSARIAFVFYAAKWCHDKSEGHDVYPETGQELLAYAWH